jgi:hypothetical protein
MEASKNVHRPRENWKVKRERGDGYVDGLRIREKEKERAPAR